MLTKNKSVYYCEHCNKHGLSKHAVVKHEKRCKRNPDNYHPCYGCQHFNIVTEDNEHHYEGGGNDLTRLVRTKYAYCKKKDQPMHNRIAVISGWVEKYPSSFIDTIIMPTTCPDLLPHEQQEPDYRM